MISLDSEGIEDIDTLRSEICRVQRKKNANGLEQIKSKDEMKAEGINSPNMADSVMMSLFKPPVKKVKKPIKYQRARVV
jgi:phage terminase large subunit